MKFTAYILYSESLRLHYVGQTDCMERRLSEHNDGMSTFTSRARDWRVVYEKTFDNRDAAVRHERRIKKTGAGKHLASVLSRKEGLSPATK